MRKRSWVVAFVLSCAGQALASSKTVGEAAAGSEQMLRGLAATRIVNGEVVLDNVAFKFIASLRDVKGHYCAGTLISPEWILTAAHCVVGDGDQRTSPDEIVFNDLSLGTAEKGEVKRKPNLAIGPVVHPKYDADAKLNDIALFKLDAPVTGIEPVALAITDPLPNMDSVVVGFGLTKENGVISNNLRKVTIPIVADGVCADVYGNFKKDAMICSGGKGGKDACQGDSGGPLLVGGAQVGVVSFGRGCARDGIPGVYSRVSSYVPFILQTTQSELRLANGNDPSGNLIRAGEGGDQTTVLLGVSAAVVVLGAATVFAVKGRSEKEAARGGFSVPPPAMMAAYGPPPTMRGPPPMARGPPPMMRGPPAAYAYGPGYGRYR